MAYDEGLAARIREHAAGEPVEEKKMFGGLAFLLGGHMAVAASREGGLLVRVEPAETDRLLEEPGATPFAMGNRGPMDGWLRVSAEAVADEGSLERWVERGLAYARSLPPK
jgi:TfoX/Sxy family transcriptional regulator of competence genes